MSDGERESLFSTASTPQGDASSYRPCIIIPYYRHEHAIAGTVARLRDFGLQTWIVDDGSGDSSSAVLQALAQAEAAWLHVHRYAQNRGKGEAVMTGCALALSAGFSHAIQIDADGQHNAADLPRLLALSRTQPAALITGIPIYDDSVPSVRRYGRYLTHVCVWIETLSLQIRDSMCGFRIYPLAAALAIWNQGRVGRRMDFDTSIIVRLYWSGVTVVNVPTRVTYPADGVSHFRMLRDNLRLIWMHLRLLAGMCLRLPQLLRRSA